MFPPFFPANWRKVHKTMKVCCGIWHKDSTNRFFKSCNILTSDPSHHETAGITSTAWCWFNSHVSVWNVTADNMKISMSGKYQKWPFEMANNRCNPVVDKDLYNVYTHTLMFQSLLLIPKKTIFQLSQLLMKINILRLFSFSYSWVHIQMAAM